MKLDRAWLNPYIARCDSVQDALLACKDDAPSDEELLLLRNKVARFSNLICEGCSGSGAHLLELARLNPGTLCIGFELRFKRAVRTVEKARAGGIENLLVIRTDARRMKELFPTNSLLQVHVNFPDPWDRHRWHKHRVVSPQYLNDCALLLEPGGTFHYKTDHQECFAEVLRWLRELPAFIIEMEERDLHNSPLSQGNVRTEFEKLFLSKRLPISALRARKVA